MPELSRKQLEATAAAYEARLVPALFQPWVEPMAKAAQLCAGQHVLDVACGTGALTRSLPELVGRTGSVVGLDTNPGMLAVAERIAPNVDWRQGNVDGLPFENESFDAVLCQFGLMLFPEPIAALREMERVLAPGGQIAVAVFGGLERNTAYAAMANAYERRVGQEVANTLRFPFSLGDRSKLLSLFGAAGLDGAVSMEREARAQFPSVRDMVLSDVEGWFPLAGLELDEDSIEAVVRDATADLAPFTTGSGAVTFPVFVHIATVPKA